MENRMWFSWQEYSRGLGLRMIFFAFLGVGWDVLMTFLQQIIAGVLTLNAINPASAWMYFAYAGIPIFFYPIGSAAQRFHLPYPLKILIYLLVFYIIEFLFGFTLKQFGITAWDYGRYLEPRWVYQGIITWHPVFLVAWTVFVILAEKLETIARGTLARIFEKRAF